MARNVPVPERLDWVPGENTDRIGYTVREALSVDWPGVRDLFRDAGLPEPTDAVLSKWTSQHRYVIRVALRNGRHVIGCCVSRHSLDGSRIVFVHSDASYKSWQIDWRLIRLAAFELPESSLRMMVRHDDDWVEELRSRGWRAVSVEPDAGGDDLYDFQFDPVVGPGDFKSGRPGSARSEAPARGVPDGRPSGGRDGDIDAGPAGLS